MSPVSDARLGSLGVAALIPFPPLPTIISEWAAIIPLVCHLASQRDDYITTGDVARSWAGYLWDSSPDLALYLACLDCWIKGPSTWTMQALRAALAVLFETLNGEVSFLARTALLVVRSLAISVLLRTVTSEKDESKPSIRAGGEAIRRSQILHVYQLHRVPKRCSTRDRFDQLRLSLPGQIIYSLILLSLAVLFGLLGSYGSAALVACTSVSELVALNITIRRPSTYLKNNETHDACMLVASHENATEWHLYIGDRGIAHTILNKPMFVVPEGLWARVASSWFRFANLLQFAAMTFVAAQKGWDGVWMVVILATHWTVHYTLYGRTLARDWLEREGVQVKVASFEFGGRYAMMGAIHIFSRSAVTRWMDDILVPHRRREAWLQCLKGEQVTVELDAHDTTWVKSNSEAACAAASVLEETFETAARNITPMAV